MSRLIFLDSGPLGLAVHRKDVAIAESFSKIGVATTNPAHLSRYVAADLWQNI